MKCCYCSESIDEEEPDLPANGAWHRACLIRALVGSVGHQKHRCSCYHGIGNGDPKGMTVRQAALAAADYFDRFNQQPNGKQLLCDEVYQEGADEAV